MNPLEDREIPDLLSNLQEEEDDCFNYDFGTEADLTLPPPIMEEAAMLAVFGGKPILDERESERLSDLLSEILYLRT